MIIYQKVIKRSDLQANPGLLYVFGDNHFRKGLGGQAKEMRGEPNAFGVRTKKTPWDCFEDNIADLNQFKSGIDVDLGELKRAGSYYDNYWPRIVVFPTDGIGTGLAKLPPNFLEYLNKKLLEVGIINGK